MRLRSTALLVLLALAGCARHANDAEVRAHFESKSITPPGSVMDAGNFPTPFTAEQIRDATKAGRTYRYRIESEGEPVGERVMTFTKVDAEGAELVTDGGAPKRVAWEELRKHAEFPAPVVSTRNEKITVPAGTFDCVVYVVQGTPGEVRTFYFAKELPGAPVLFFTEKNQKRVMTSTLVEHKPGK